MKHVMIDLLSLALLPAMLHAGVWRWSDQFIASFVDAEGINLYPGSPQEGEEFDGQMLGVVDVPGPGVEVHYRLTNTVGQPVDNSVAGIEAWKPDGADWLGLAAATGLGPVWQWGQQLHMDATAYESAEIPLWYVSGAGLIQVRAFCVTGTAGSSWIETQINSQTVQLQPGESAVLTVDLTASPDRTRMAKVAVVVEAAEDSVLGQNVTLHIGSIRNPMAQVQLADYGPSSDYRWLDVANQAYSPAFQGSYSYGNADVLVTYNPVGRGLHGTLRARNLKPNFAYQFKLVGEPGTETNERIGLAGRWWQQEWTGTEWTAGWNLNDKGGGSSPNPNDTTYLARRDTPDASSPTGLHYRYSGYRVFDYFITDPSGNAEMDFAVEDCYHVLWKTSQQTPGIHDGPVIQHTFDVDPSRHWQYTTDYPSASEGIFGEWERLPKGGVGLLPGHYTCSMLLTEESFHGSGLQGWWAHAMIGNVDFTIQAPFECAEPIVGDVNGDCKVDLEDIALIALSWLKCNRLPQSACWE